MRFLLINILIFVFAGSAFAAQYGGSVAIQYVISPRPITLYAPSQNLSITLVKVNGKTSYVASDFKAFLPVKFHFVSDINTASPLVFVNNNIVLSDGTHTASVTVACRVRKDLVYPTSVTDGADCATFTNDAASFDMYVALFPVAVTFSSADAAPGNFTGSGGYSVDF